MFTLLLDQDGPLADFDQAFWDLCEAMGFEMDIDSLTHPKRKRFMSDNIIDKEHKKIARAYIESGHNRWFHDLPVTPGAKEGVAELLSRKDIDVWVCTKPLEVNDRCRDDKGLWIRKHFPELENKLILAPNKGMVVGDVLLDDAPKAEWFPHAVWEPVIFPSIFNEGGEWADLRRWTWGDPIEELIGG